MNRFWLFFALIAISLTQMCKSLQTGSSMDDTRDVVTIPESNIIPPPVEGESIINEKGEEVVNHTEEIDFFKKKSIDPREYFRVYISGKDYQVRQIRGSSKMKRRPDVEGDSLVRDEIGNFDIVNLVDEGIIYVSLNVITGGFEVITFDGRVPRINEIAKIIQNDVMRWQLEHEMRDDKPQITRFKVYYQIQLKQLLTREEVKARYLLKKKKK